MKTFYLSMLFVLLMLAGCSSNGGSSSGSSNIVAHLVDGPVEGVSYNCDSIDGITDQNGSFEYHDGWQWYLEGA